MFGQQGMGQGPCTLTRRARAVCKEREPTGRVISVVVAERKEKREDNREESRERERMRRTTEERKKKEERKREGTRERREPPFLPPCVGSKRLRVSVHTEAF